MRKRPVKLMKKQQKYTTKNSPKLRPLGHVLLDLEPLILEMCTDHDLQWSDVLFLIYGYLQVHCPDAQEKYNVGGGSPEFYYGSPRSEVKTCTEE